MTLNLKRAIAREFLIFIIPLLFFTILTFIAALIWEHKRKENDDLADRLRKQDQQFISKRKIRDEKKMLLMIKKMKREGVTKQERLNLYNAFHNTPYEINDWYGIPSFGPIKNCFGEIIIPPNTNLRKEAYHYKNKLNEMNGYLFGINIIDGGIGVIYIIVLSVAYPIRMLVVSIAWALRILSN